MAANQLYNTLLHELRLNSRSGRLNQNSTVFKYIKTQFEKHQTTQETFCKARQEMKFLGQAYLTYLQSTRKYSEIQAEYKGRGELSIQDTADLVGFKLPGDSKHTQD